ncbi:hypothetical protein AWB82_05918 [Caballeronia glebae]|uniref:Uncharacterized protein n=1 Tax=Caballeronia glebae TaxID=1777143 RepID=A0A158CWP0_9BURK|nr:hypothetical protein [Caballeronia glebae]SAK86758.1 hypothetical protein AWB82_05918 [Caballeronia glebae]
MSRTTVEMLRAYLMTASLLAMCMDGAIVTAALFFHVPDAIFEGSMFRLVALTMLVVHCGGKRLRSPVSLPERARWRLVNGCL